MGKQEYFRSGMHLRSYLQQQLIYQCENWDLESSNEFFSQTLSE